MKRILKGLSWCIILIGTVGYPLIAKCMEDQDEELYKTIFKIGAPPHEGYKILNEGDNFIQTYNQNYNQNNLRSFESLDENKYKIFIKQEKLFDTKVSSQKKILNLMRWCQLAGCPLLAVNQYRQFFYTGLHIYTPGDIPVVLGNKVLTTEEREDLINQFERPQLYEDGCTKVSIRKGTDNTTYKKRDITQDLRDNAVRYQYINSSNTDYDSLKFDQDGANHYNNHRKAKISYDFLKDYIVPLNNIPYIDQILGGLASLPKIIVNVMSGKAIYLSTQNGVSLTAYVTSHNAPVDTYLGLIPGVFIEHHPARPDNGVNMTLRNLVHEIGHLIDYSALQAYLALPLPLQGNSISFPQQFPQFQLLKGERDNLFKKNPNYLKNKGTDLCKTKPGYITNYSESSLEEDFAEHFTYFIITDFKKKFEKVMKKDKIIKGKYQFMKKMIEATSSERKDL